MSYYLTQMRCNYRLRDQAATCPNCRVEITKATTMRNLAVEKAVSELPSKCQVFINGFLYPAPDSDE